VFTARYALSLYIKQIRCVFKGLIDPSLSGSAILSPPLRFPDESLITHILSFPPYRLHFRIKIILDLIVLKCTGYDVFRYLYFVSFLRVKRELFLWICLYICVFLSWPATQVEILACYGTNESYYFGQISRESKLKLKLSLLINVFYF
jgi:hypothetical protein